MNSFPKFVTLAVATSILLTGCAGFELGLSPEPGSSQNAKSDENPSSNTTSSDGGVIAPNSNLETEININNLKRTPYTESMFTTRSDSHGTYAVTKINYPSIDMVKNKGVSKTALASALKFYTDFVVTEAIDSIAFDDYSRYDEWVKTVAPKYVSKDFFDEVTRAQEKGLAYAGLIFNNYEPGRSQVEEKNLIPVLIRDGMPRVFNKNIWSLEASPMGGGMLIRGFGSAVIIVDDKNHLEWDAKLFGAGSGDSFPRYSDGINATAPLVFEVALTLIQEGDDCKIIDFANQFAIDKLALLEPNTFPLELRKSFQ